MSMKSYESWTEFGEGKYPDCHYEGRQWPGSVRELILNGFVEGTYLRQLYPVRSSGVGAKNDLAPKMKSPVSKTCNECKNWMGTDVNPHEGICCSTYSLASTADTVEACFTCDYWEQKD
jgi:hypothetical protein